MATLEESARAKLLADAAVAALVATRVYPQVAPPGAALPRIVYQEADRQYVQHLKGRSPLNSYDMEIECCAATYAEAKALGKAVEAALNSKTWVDEGNLVRVRGVFHVSEQDSYFETLDGSDEPYHQYAITLRLFNTTNVN